MTTWNTPNMEKAKTKTERANFRSSTSSSNMREKAWNNRFILGKIQDYNIYDNQYYLSMKLNHEHTKYFQQAKTELQTIQQRQYSSTGFSNIRTPYSKSFNAQIEEEEGNSSTVIDRIRILWNELGVVDDFRLLFGLVAEQLDDGNRDDFIRNEIDSLEYLALLLKTMTDDIHQQKSLIKTIKQRDIDIGYFIRNSKNDNNNNDNNNNDNDNKVDETLIDEVIEKMQLIRRTTISIIQSMTKIRENCAYSILGGKFDLTRLNKKYYFDKNYLIKMKDQLDFLTTSNLSHFFNFTEGDPFLLQPIEPKEKEGRSVPLSDDMLLEIKRCKYYILLDMIYFQIGNAKGKIFRKSSSPSSTRSGGKNASQYKQHGPNTWIGSKRDRDNNTNFNTSKYNKGAVTSKSSVNYPELNSNNFSMNSRTDFAKKGTETGKNSSSVSSPLGNQNSPGNRSNANKVNRKVQTLHKNNKGSLSSINLTPHNNSNSMGKDMEKKVALNEPLAKVRKEKGNNDLLEPINKKKRNANIDRGINENSNEEESMEEGIKKEENKQTRGKSNVKLKEIKHNKSNVSSNANVINSKNSKLQMKDKDLKDEIRQNQSILNQQINSNKDDDNDNDNDTKVIVYQVNDEEMEKEDNMKQSNNQCNYYNNAIEKEDKGN